VHSQLHCYVPGVHYYRWRHKSALQTRNTRRDRSRGIRDEATACEPEVVSRERTWPPRPVAQPSQATGRPFGTKYDNIDQNKAKRKVPGALEAKPEVEIWRRPDFFDSETTTSYLTSNTSQCLSHTVTQFYNVNIKSRPKYTTTSGLTTTTFLTHISDKNKFHGISDHFRHFWKYLRFLNCTSGLQI